MIIVIQCAAKKRPNAGYLRRKDGSPVLFVADPHSAPPSTNHLYARPDDVSDTGETWRQFLLSYNRAPGSNLLGLLPAWELYANGTYEKLAGHMGQENLFVLSAGWGLIKADFLTPAYDITFSATAEKYKRRRKTHRYGDFRMLPADTMEPVVFFGGKDYIGLFCHLTDGQRAERYIFYNSATPPEAPGCILKRFATTTRTNWHYECAHAFIDQRIAI